MDNVTQQNAALVQEAAAAAESLQDQAGNLTQVVSVFKLDATYVATRKVAPKKPIAAPAIKASSSRTAGKGTPSADKTKRIPNLTTVKSDNWE